MSENIKLVADLKIEKVDASALASILKSEISKTTTALTGGTTGGKGGTSAKGGGDIALALQAVLGEQFDEIIAILQGVVKALLALIGIGLAVKIIADVIGAFWNGFQSVGKVFGAILTMITKMVEPFANLLIPLMLPFLSAMTQVARILNVMLLPFFSAMMKAFSGLGQSTQQAVSQIFEGDMTGAINTMLEGYVEAFETLKTELTGAVIPLLQRMATWIMGILTIDTASIKNTLQNLIGNELGAVVGTMIEIWHGLISAVGGFIASILGGKTLFDQVFGAGSFDNLKETNEGFAWGVSAGETLKSIWNWLLDFFGKLSKIDLGKIFIDLAQLLASILIPAFTFIGSWLNDNKGAIRNAFIDLLYQLPLWTTAITSLKTEINNILTGAWPNIKTALETLSDSLGSFSQMLDSINMDDIVGGVKTGAKTTAITGSVPAGIGAAVGSYVINNYISGNGDKFLEDKVKTGVEDLFARYSRQGFFQKGY